MWEGALDHLQAALGELASKVAALQAQPQPHAALDEGFLRQVILEGISELASDLQRKAETFEGGVAQRCQELEKHTLEVESRLQTRSTALGAEVMGCKQWATRVEAQVQARLEEAGKKLKPP